jgi:hypothetical protein
VLSEFCLDICPWTVIAVALLVFLSEIFSNENNQIASREVLMKVCLPGKISVAN